MPDQVRNNIDDDWSTWRLWVRDHIVILTKDSNDLYDIYHNLKDKVGHRQHELENGFLKAINDTREAYRSELNELDKKIDKMNTILTVVYAIIALLFGSGFLYPIVSKWW